MPMYEFLCEACEHRFEKILPIERRNLRKCPECGERKLRKLLFAPKYHDRYSPMHPRKGRGRGW